MKIRGRVSVRKQVQVQPQQQGAATREANAGVESIPAAVTVHFRSRGLRGPDLAFLDQVGQLCLPWIGLELNHWGVGRCVVFPKC